MAERKLLPVTPIGGARTATWCRWVEDANGDHHLMIQDRAHREQRYATVCPHHPHGHPRGAFRVVCGWSDTPDAAVTLEAAKLLCEMSLAEDRNFPP